MTLATIPTSALLTACARVRHSAVTSLTLLMTLLRCGEAMLAKAARSLGQNIHRIW